MDFQLLASYYGSFGTNFDVLRQSRWANSINLRKWGKY